MDPFAARNSRSVRVTFNSSSIAIPRFDSLLFENAHATLIATFTSGGADLEFETPAVTGSINYRTATQQTEFRLGPLDLASVSQAAVSVVRDIGPLPVGIVLVEPAAPSRH